MPAEWEPHAATWLCWPHNPETWPGGLPEAEAEFRHFVEILSESEAVQILTQNPEHRARVQKQVPTNVSLHVVETNDSWMRDIGPTFVQRDDGGVVAIDWTFNSWGQKYPPWDRDDATASEVARLAGVERLRPELVLEGGALETDGEGTLLITRSSAIGERRNPGLTADALEKRLSPLLGVERFIWLDGALEGDDTDAHIDNLARFTAPGRVVCASEQNRADPNFEALQVTLGQLRETDLEVVELPMPKPLYAGRERLPRVMPTSTSQTSRCSSRALVARATIPRSASWESSSRNTESSPSPVRVSSRAWAACTASHSHNPVRDRKSPSRFSLRPEIAVAILP